MTITKIVEITDNNNPASVMHDDPREALAQVHSLALGIAEQVTSGGWAIDMSTGRPILVKDSCSVIEAEDAYYVLGLLRKESSGSTDDSTSEFIRECARRGISYGDVCETGASAPAQFCYIAKWSSESGHESVEVFNDIHPAREFLDLRGVVGQIVSMGLRGQGYVDALKGA